jgi:hypothetical protein
MSANTIASPGATAGALSITVPPGPVDLGTYADAASARTIAGTLGTIRVDDTRGGSAATGWVATVTSTSFTPPAGPPIPPTAISYSTGPLAQIRGHAAHARHDATDLSTAAAVVTVTGASGDNAAVTSWTPSIAIIVPDTAVAGIYTATITHSVL